MKKSPEELLAKKQRDNLRGLCNRIASAFSFKTLKIWGDVYRMQGIPEESFPPNHKDAVTYPELKAHFVSLQQKLEERLSPSMQSPATAFQAVTNVKQEEPLPLKESPKLELTAPIEPATLDTHNADDDYGFLPSPHETAFLYWFQKKAVTEIVKGFTVDFVKSLLLLSSTGTGKTFMAGAAMRRLVDVNFADNKTYGAVKYLYVTRSTIVEQTKRVFEKFFNLGIKDGVEILNIEQLRSRAGAVWVQEKMQIIDGKEVWTWEWRKMLNPVVVFWDECQALKNDTSSQHNIAAAFNNIKSPTHQLFISATPFTRVSEAKCFAVATRKNISQAVGMLEPMILSNDTWPTYASSISAPSDPTEYNEAAVERLTKDLEKYIIRVKGVRSQFEAHNTVTMVSFTTKEERDYYHQAWERYLAEKAKLEAEGQGDGKPAGMMILVQFLKFRMAAEYCRRRIIAQKMYNSVQEGYAACAALNFKGSIIGIVRILVEEMGVPRDKISLVWGGGQTQLTKKQKVKASMTAKAEALKAVGLDLNEMMEAMDLDSVDDRVLEVIPEHLCLGPQTPEERQKEIDKFQSGKSHYCLYTFRAGGVGLSLHHTDEFTKEKTRKKPSGYAYEEDIPLIPVRPRINFVAPTYSAIELVQGLGRCPRLTSLSNTKQELLFYKGTIEDDVSKIVAQKLRCLSRVVKMKESWQDVVVGGVKTEDHIKNTEGLEDDPDALEGGEDDDD
jgi:hypothetical protein